MVRAAPSLINRGKSFSADCLPWSNSFDYSGNIFPDTLTGIANTFGIGRGADLVIYLVTIGLLFFSVSTYLKFGDMDRRITVLSRHIALLESKDENGRVDPDSLK